MRNIKFSSDGNNITTFLEGIETPVLTFSISSIKDIRIFHSKEAIDYFINKSIEHISEFHKLDDKEINANKILLTKYIEDIK